MVDLAVGVRTIGHGTLPEQAFTDLIRGADVAGVADIRSFPGSRHNPQYGTAEMARWLPKAGVSYSWIRELGGRRTRVESTKHVALRNPSFQAYADHMESELFVDAVDELLAHGENRAVMCSESVWWRCHRRLLADYLVLVRGVAVCHLMHNGHLTAHVLTDGVRSAGDRLIDDVGATAPLLEP